MNFKTVKERSLLTKGWEKEWERKKERKKERIMIKMIEENIKKKKRVAKTKD